MSHDPAGSANRDASRLALRWAGRVRWIDPRADRPGRAGDELNLFFVGQASRLSPSFQSILHSTVLCVLSVPSASRPGGTQFLKLETGATPVLLHRSGQKTAPPLNCSPLGRGQG
jgi:hypothetical protein